MRGKLIVIEGTDCSGKETQTNIAKKFNVNYNTINTINCCKSWTHLHNYQNNIRQEAKERRQKSI